MCYEVIIKELMYLERMLLGLWCCAVQLLLWFSTNNAGVICELLQVSE